MNVRRAPRWPAVLAWLVAALAVFGPVIVSVWLELRLRAAGTSFNALQEEPFLAGLVWMLAWVGYPIVGAVILKWQPRNRIGWLTTGIGLLIALLAPLDGYARAAPVLGLPGAVWSGWLTGVAGLPVLAFVAMLLATFPDGRIRRPLPSWFGWFVFATAAVLVGAKALRPGQTDVELPSPIQLPLSRAPFEAVVVIATLVLIAAGVAALVVLLRAFRRSTGVERLQLRWFVTPLVVLPIAMPLVIGVGMVRPLPDILYEFTIPIAFMVTFLGNAAGIGIALTRHGLYEIDRIISRTVSWFTVTALLVGGYAGTVLALQAVLRALGAPDSDLVVAASTLLMAAAARPLFRRVRTVVDRRFNRTSYDVGRIVGSLTSSLRDEVDPESVADALASSVHRSLQPATVWTWTVDQDVSPPRARA